MRRPPPPDFAHRRTGPRRNPSLEMRKDRPVRDSPRGRAAVRRRGCRIPGRGWPNWRERGDRMNSAYALPQRRRSDRAHWQPGPSAVDVAPTLTNPRLGPYRSPLEVVARWTWAPNAPFARPPRKTGSCEPGRRWHDVPAKPIVRPRCPRRSRRGLDVVADCARASAASPAGPSRFPPR